MSERRLVFRKREMTIKEGDYAGWNFTAITNPRLKVIELLTDQTIKSMVEGLAQILVPPWNFVDEDGAQMADPSPDTIRSLPLDLIQAISTTYIEGSTTVPPK